MTEQEALKALSERNYSLDLLFSETANEGYMDFARCQRPNGSIYGTSGQCRQGKEVGAAEEKPKRPRRSRQTEPKKEEGPKVQEPKAEGPKEEPKKEPKGYKPREGEPESRKGILGIKDRLTGGKKKDLDNLVDDVDEVRQNMERYISSLEKKKGEATSKKEKQRAQEGIDKAKELMERSLARAPVNKKFAEDLKKNLPANVSAKVDENTGEILLTQRVGRHKIETDFSSGQGFNYKVNGRHDVGTVKDRKQQLRIAMAVRAQYDALVKSIPDGTVITTSAYNEDGNGAARQKAYERIGFSAPEASGKMYAMKKNGRMVPSSGPERDQAFLDPSTVWFAEGTSEDDKESIKAWFEIITGTELGGKQE